MAHLPDFLCKAHILLLGDSTMEAVRTESAAALQS